jgi:hypothetical protein
VEYEPKHAFIPTDLAGWIFTNLSSWLFDVAQRILSRKSGV